MSQQLNSGRQARAIVPTVTTASFKPLSLDEIMLVPLAKQKAEDQMIMDMDELDLMATNSLDADNAYVNAQRDAFKNEVQSTRDRLMTEGVDRSLINKFKGLRSRKNLEFSVNGQTGKANAAYNAMQLNKKNIMNDPKLTPEQQRLGILEAERAYNKSGGVAAGAEYIDYIGNEYIDTNAEAQKIGAQMSPQQIADANGYTFDGKNYKDGSNKTVILTPEQIQRVAYQTMLSNEKQMAYLKEAERLGIIPSADDALRTAAINAGNIYQRNNRDTTAMAQVGGSNGGAGKGNQNWTTVNYNSSQGGFYDKSEYLDRVADDLFVGGTLVDVPENYDPAEDKRRRSAYESMQGSFASGKKKINFNDPEAVKKYQEWQTQNYGDVYEAINEDRIEIKEKIADLKSKYPKLTTQLKPAVMAEDGVTVLEPARQYNDQEIHNMYIQGRKDAEFSFAEAVLPLNKDNSFEVWTSKIIGTKDKPGIFKNLDMSINGEEPVSMTTLAEEHFDGNVEELREAISKGVGAGVLPEHPYMPGATAISITDPNDPNVDLIIAVKGEGKTKDMFNTVSRMNNQLINGTPHSKMRVRSNKTGEIINQHIITDMDPATGSMDSYTLRTEGNYTKKQIDDFVFKYNDEKQASVAYNKDGTLVVPHVVRRSKSWELNKAMGKVSNMFDSTAQGKTKL